MQPMTQFGRFARASGAPLRAGLSARRSRSVRFSTDARDDNLEKLRVGAVDLSGPSAGAVATTTADRCSTRATRSSVERHDLVE
jgi:hypothetical protein